MTNALPKDRALSTDFTRFWHFSFSIVDNSRKRHLYHNSDQKPTHLVFLACWALSACKDFFGRSLPFHENFTSLKHLSYTENNISRGTGEVPLDVFGPNIAAVFCSLDVIF
jgi:hypothetical protein